MNLFQFDIDNKILIIFITSLVWAINFRSTFKNIDSHMDSGSYTSLKFDNLIILLKNILCCFYLVGFYIELNLNKTKAPKEKQLIKTYEGNMVVFQYKEEVTRKDGIMDSIFKLHKLTNKKEKFLFLFKIFCIIVLIYFTEEIYFIIVNNHILDRLICPIRNLGFLISTLIFSPLLIKNSWVLYRHQFIPLIIIFILSISIICFNFIQIERFKKIFGLNFIFYLFSFSLMGLEMVLIKYLVDEQFINIFLILGIKGIIGTLVFTIINLIYNKVDFFTLFDKILFFEYDEMYEVFDITPKIIYIISLTILQYLKIFVINKFTENHLLSVVMITDLIYFPFYCIERFQIQKFGISNYSSFCLNSLLGIINTLLMLIFNEILECKFWGLDTNLKKNINNRQDLEITISDSKLNSNSSLNEEEAKNRDSDIDSI